MSANRCKDLQPLLMHVNSLIRTFQKRKALPTTHRRPTSGVPFTFISSDAIAKRDNAAGLESSIGNVATGRWFATLTSAGARPWL